MKYSLKRGDEVVVLSGNDKGKSGKILEILRSTCRVVVEGVAIRKKHLKKSQENPEGAILEKEGSVHYSNVMLKGKHDERIARRVK